MPLMYIPSSYHDSPFGSTCHSYQHPYYQHPFYQPYAQPQDEGHDFSYAALMNRQREHELQRQRREEARIQRERQRELRLKLERERLIREMIQQRDMERCRQMHHQRNLERQHQYQSRHRALPSFHSVHRAEPLAPSTPVPIIQSRSPMEQYILNTSGMNRRQELDDDSASTDEDASEGEYEDLEWDQAEQREEPQSSIPNSTSPQVETRSEPSPPAESQPQPSRSLNQIVELEEKLHSLLTEKLPSLNRLQLEGHLTNLLLEADRIDPHGEPDEDTVREKRRELVRAVEQVLGGNETSEGDMGSGAEEKTMDVEEEEEEVENELQPLTI